jgi:hypothetical protein
MHTAFWQNKPVLFWQNKLVLFWQNKPVLAEPSQKAEQFQRDPLP